MLIMYVVDLQHIITNSKPYAVKWNIVHVTAAYLQVCTLLRCHSHTLIYYKHQSSPETASRSHIYSVRLAQLSMGEFQTHVVVRLVAVLFHLWLFIFSYCFVSASISISFTYFALNLQNCVKVNIKSLVTTLVILY